MRSSLTSQIAIAQLHLRRRDPVLKRLIGSVGTCTLRRDPKRFQALVRSIIAQQISTRAAVSIHTRLKTALASTGVTPAAIVDAGPKTLRAAGLSANKIRSLTDLAEHVLSGALPLDRLHRWPDEKVIETLVPVRGIGRWTAEMFLIFSLGRLDVLPVGDYGLRSGIRLHYEMKDLPSPKELALLAEPWRPYRSIATWYVWRSLAP
jgi:DNA-3-methyladenine glycosylase II